MTNFVSFFIDDGLVPFVICLHTVQQCHVMLFGMLSQVSPGNVYYIGM